jgi:hypothetical protein
MDEREGRSGGIPNESGCAPITATIIDHRTRALFDHIRAEAEQRSFNIFNAFTMSPFAFHELALSLFSI